jgi:hypothetical protein
MLSSKSKCDAAIGERVDFAAQESRAERLSARVSILTVQKLQPRK